MSLLKIQYLQTHRFILNVLIIETFSICFSVETNLSPKRIRHLCWVKNAMFCRRSTSSPFKEKSHFRLFLIKMHVKQHFFFIIFQIIVWPHLIWDRKASMGDLWNLIILYCIIYVQDIIRNKIQWERQDSMLFYLLVAESLPRSIKHVYFLL